MSQGEADTADEYSITLFSPFAVSVHAHDLNPRTMSDTLLELFLDSRTMHEWISIVDLTARHLDTLSNSELATHMGWSDADARGPGVDAEASIAVGLLREGLPEAMEKGVVRILDGMEYNIPMSSADNPNMGRTPALSIMWHVLSSTSDDKAFDTESLHWRVR